LRVLLRGSARFCSAPPYALAVALCHAHHHTAQTRLLEALARAPAARAGDR
jgi:hypothetical protein